MLDEKQICLAPKSTAAAVANEFLELGTMEPSYPPIDQMKLQKLLFYAHGWCLAIFEAPLFEEDFEAWPWGPVLHSIYSQTRKFGQKPITCRMSEIRKTGPGIFDFRISMPEAIKDIEIKKFIKYIWDNHKEYTGIQLSNSTHAPNEPWTIIKQNYGSLEQKPNIPNMLIKTIFKKKLEDAKFSSNITPT